MRDIPEELSLRLHALQDRVLDENTRMNLTALRTPDACWIGNILDSLAFLEIVERLENARTVIDIGTGGGFPLLPLSIALPHSRLTGLDSTGKKSDAVRRIAAHLELTNVELITARAEDAAHDDARRSNYDIVTARAVAALPTLLEFTAPFARIGGHIVLWKSLRAREELARSNAAQNLLKISFLFEHHYTLPGDFGERMLLVFRKEAPTPTVYPRKTGIPSKQPLA